MEIKPSRDNPTNPGAIERLIEDADWLGAYVARHAMNNSARHKAEDINKVLEAARAELARLQAENELLHMRDQTTIVALAGSTESKLKLRDLEAENERLRSYASHKPDCATFGCQDWQTKCDCGYDKLREALEGRK